MDNERCTADTISMMVHESASTESHVQRPHSPDPSSQSNLPPMTTWPSHSLQSSWTVQSRYGAKHSFCVISPSGQIRLIPSSESLYTNVLLHEDGTSIQAIDPDGGPFLCVGECLDIPLEGQQGTTTRWKIDNITKDTTDVRAWILQCTPAALSQDDTTPCVNK